MSDGQCPKCNSNAVHVVDTAHLSIPISTFSVAPLGFYVCARCGYVELCVKDKDLLPKIAERYMSVAELREIGPR
jgi:predicted nucleic-acid-binding Zn-ribbon protein